MSNQFDDQFVSFQSAVAGRYSLERELGRGGMGIVYLAREVRLDRPVAIKLLPPQAQATGLRDRFLREARTAAKLSHPHVISIYAVEEIDQFVFFAMAYVEGRTLTARVRERGPMPPSEATKMLREVAWALAYAHEQGVIHRDVKPDNILLEDATGRALVADFGIAGLVKDASTWDGNSIAGTPEFMSPEAALGETIDHRSDLYSLGAVAFFALSGRLPFEAATTSEVLAKQVSEPAPTLTAIAPGIPRRLGQIVDQCLAKDRQQRPQSAAQLGETLFRNIEQRKDLPVALRVFVKHEARLDGAGILIYPWAALLVSGGIAAAVGSMTAGFLALGVSMTAGPVALLTSRARRLLAAGFRHEDLDVAFKSEMERGREERAFRAGPKPTVLEKVFGWTSAVTVPTAIIGLNLLIYLVSTGFDATSLLSRTLLAVFPTSGIVGIGSGFAYLVLLQRRRDVDSEFWSKVWSGKLGRWMFKVARTFLPKRALPSPMTHRPTEMVIAMAADQLFADLPKETRKGLADLPEVVARLEADARRMRARLEELQDTLIDDPQPSGGSADPKTSRLVAELRVEREKVQSRLGDSVVALETIRLSLLHLHAGKVTVRSLTTDLSRAREIAKDVDRLMEGAREVEIILKTPTSRRTDGQTVSDGS